MTATITTLSAEQLQALLNEPAGMPPAGVTPDFQNPSNLETPVILGLAFCLAISTLVVFIRIYTKIFLIRSLAYEDYAIVIGWMGSIFETVASRFCNKYGSGIHMWNLKLEDFSKQLYWINIDGIIYNPVIFFIKLSILLQYLRIFVPTRKGNMILFVGIHICIWSNFIFYLANFILLIAMCHPRERIWKPWITIGHCANTNGLNFSTGFFNIASDFAILILPIPSLWKLQMPLKRKILMTTIFATGFLACITSILRTYYTFKVVRLPDISYNVVAEGMWISTEVAIGIIVSCLPVLPKFFQHIGPKIYRTLFSGTRSLGKSTDNVDSGGVQKRQKAPLAQKIPFPRRNGNTNDLESWSKTFRPDALSRAEYITLDDYEPKPTGKEALLTHSTKRNDLETGEHGTRGSSQAVYEVEWSSNIG